MKIINNLRKISIVWLLLNFIAATCIYGKVDLTRDDLILRRNGSVFFRTGDNGDNRQECKASNANGVSFHIRNNPVCLGFRGKGYRVEPAKTTHPVFTEYKFIGLTGDTNGVSQFTVKVGDTEISCEIRGVSAFFKKELSFNNENYEIGLSVKKETNAWLLHTAQDYSSNAMGVHNVDEATAYLIGIEYIKKLDKNLESKKKEVYESELVLDEIEKLQKKAEKKLEEVIVAFKLLEKAQNYNDSEKITKQIQNSFEEVKKWNEEARRKGGKFSENINLWKGVAKIEDSLKQIDIYNKRAGKVFEQAAIKFKSFKLRDEMNDLWKIVQSKLKQAEMALKAKDRKDNVNKATEAFEKVKDAYLQINESMKIAEKVLKENPDEKYVKKVADDIFQYVFYIKKHFEKAQNDLKTIEQDTRLKEAQKINEIRKNKKTVEEKLKEVESVQQLINGAKDLNEAQEQIKLAKKIYQEAQEIEKSVIYKINEISDNIEAKRISEEVISLMDKIKQSIQKSEETIKKFQEEIYEREEKVRIKKAEIFEIIKKQQNFVELELEEAREALRIAENSKKLEVAQNAAEKIKNATKQIEEAIELAMRKAAEISSNLEAQILSLEMKESLKAVNQLAEEIQECINKIKEEDKKLEEAQKIAEEVRIKKAKILEEIKKQQELVELQLKEAREALAIVETTKDLNAAKVALDKVKVAATKALKAAEVAKNKAGEISSNVEAQQAFETAKTKAQEAQDCFKKAQEKVNKLQEAEKAAKRRAEEIRIKEAKILGEIKKQQELVELQLKAAKEALKIAETTKDMDAAKAALDKVKVAAAKAQKAAEVVKNKAGEISSNVEAQQAFEAAKNKAQEVQDCFKKAQEKVNKLQEAEKAAKRRAEEIRIKEAKILGEIKKQQELVELQLKAAKEALKIAETTKDVNAVKAVLNKVRIAAIKAQKSAEVARNKAGEIASNIEAQQVAEVAKNKAQEAQDCFKKAQEEFNKLQEVQKAAEKRAEEVRVKEAKLLGEIRNGQAIIENKLKDAVMFQKKAASASKSKKAQQDALNKIKQLADEAKKVGEMAQRQFAGVSNNIEAKNSYSKIQTSLEKIQACVKAIEKSLLNIQIMEKKDAEKKKLDEAAKNALKQALKIKNKQSKNKKA